MRNMPRQGEFYRHFKGMLYQIVAMAKDADTLEDRVIYQALYGSFRIYDRRLSDFMVKLDPEKYPDAAQEYRFERVELEENDNSRTIVPVKTTITPIYDEADIPVISMEKYPELENQRKEIEARQQMHLENRVKGAIEDRSSGVDPKLIAFLDADTYTKKLEIFNHMHDTITEKILNDITAVLDISPVDGSLEEQYLSIKRDLETLARFERDKH